MEYRGLILIIFGCSLMVSPLAIKLVQDQQSAAPGQVQTVASVNAACDSASISTQSYRIGCNLKAGASQRVMSGGATFVTARN